MTKKLIGKLGELLAKRYFLFKKFSLVNMNYHCRFGELDLVLKSKKAPNFLVFCEVKSRTNPNQSDPMDILSPHQVEKILKTIHVFLEKNSYNNYDWRLDLVLVLFDLKRINKRLIHYKNILLN